MTRIFTPFHFLGFSHKKYLGIPDIIGSQIPVELTDLLSLGGPSVSIASVAIARPASVRTEQHKETKATKPRRRCSKTDRAPPEEFVCPPRSQRALPGRRD